MGCMAWRKNGALGLKKKWGTRVGEWVKAAKVSRVQQSLGSGGRQGQWLCTMVLVQLVVV